MILKRKERVIINFLIIIQEKMRIEYKTDYFECTFSTVKGFNKKLQDTIDKNTKEGWRLHSYQVPGAGSQFCSLVFYKEYND